ncbi:MAG: acyl-CoA dehydrogenase family protein [Armatimonadetes bacterium]|nr:acyl-CoA dehydrogenase family protein [Armatimonadota bacterium]MDW8153653.1 acyl-CoA dehydrogenase family protein [Armatimonadota bacterium]
MDRDHLLWPFFGEAHRRLARELETWARREVGPLAAREEEDPEGMSRELVRRLGEASWLRYCVPRAYGGMFDSLDVRSLCLAREILAGYSGLADFAFAMQGLGSAPITLFGSDALRTRYLPEVASGRRIAAFALSEPQAGSDVAGITTSARRTQEGYVLEGVKTWISNAGVADFYVVFARTGGPGKEGLSAFVVDADTPGLEVSERIQVLAPHPLGTLNLRGCHVPASHRLGEEGQGFEVAMRTLDVFRPTVGAAALGFARRAFHEALEFVQRRVAFGQVLSRFQMVREKLAWMALEVDAAALLVYRAAWVKDELGQRATREASMAKLYATEAAQRVVDSAVQLWGARGVVHGSPVERLYREVRALRIYEGTSEIQALVVAQEVLRSAPSERVEEAP